MDLEIVTANVLGKGRYATINGRHYFVAPLTMIVPGVLEGSKGPLLYPDDEVRKDPDVWNIMPIVAGHPMVNGRHVTARHPQILERWGIGNVFNAKAPSSLTAEGWFDLEHTKRVDDRILTALESGKPIEVSTGVYTQNYPAPEGAIFNGKDREGKPYSKPYIAIARNYKPDHLAVLIDKEGACSVRHGCGVFSVNRNGSLSEVSLPGLDELTARDRELGDDAKWQKDELGENPPSWVADEDLWERAKKAADKGGYAGDSYWAVVVHIYRNMGGVTLSESEEEDASANAGISAAAANANPNQPRGDKGRWDKAQRVRMLRAARRGFSAITGVAVQPAPTDPLHPSPSEQQADEEANRRHSPEAVFSVTNNTIPTVTGGTLMPLSDQQRKQLIDGLTVNCTCATTKQQRVQELNGKTDDVLSAMHQAAEWAKTTPANNTQNPTPGQTQPQQAPGTQTTQNPPAPNNPSQQTTQAQQQSGQQNPPAPTGNSTTQQIAPPVFPGLFPTQQTQAPRSMDEWLAMAPPQAKEVWGASEQIYNAAKAAVIQQLVANVGDPNQKAALAQHFGAKPLQELQMMALLIPPPVTTNQNPTPSPTVNWLAANSPPPTNNTQTVTEEPLLSPTYNFARQPAAPKSAVA